MKKYSVYCGHCGKEKTIQAGNLRHAATIMVNLGWKEICFKNTRTIGGTEGIPKAEPGDLGAVALCEDCAKFRMQKRGF